MSLMEQIRTGESKKLEFKREFPSADHLTKTICAFANTGGGKLLIGVEDNRSIVGIQKEEIHLYMDRISNILHDTLHPAIVPDIYTYTLDTKMIIVAEVYPSPLRPHFLKNKGKAEGTYIRVGATNKRADLEYIQELERQKQNISYDAEMSFAATNDEIDAMLIHLLSERLHRDITVTDLFNLDLKKEGGGEKHLTNGGLLLLGKNEKAKIQCARFKGTCTDVFIDKKTIEGDLFSQIEDTMKFLLTNINLTGNDSEDFLSRKDSYEIPPAALREALINAVVHRDYATMNSDIKVAVFDDKIEITSPGDFPRGITVDEALSGRSEIRNKVLARIFSEANFIEQWGRGINRIFTLCRAAKLEEPEIRESGMFVQVRIFRDCIKTRRKNKTQKQDAKTRRKNKTQKQDANIELLQTLFSEKDNFTSREFRELSGLSRSRSAVILSELVESEVILRQGQSRSTVYRKKLK